MYAGIDIGGTKCAVTLGRERQDGEMKLLAKAQFATHGTPTDILERLAEELKRLLHEQKLNEGDLKAVGISCGGPLDSARGIVQSPPNLPGWDGIHVTDYFSNITGAPAYLENDANACAVAEWKYGAGRGKENMVFLKRGALSGSQRERGRDRASSPAPERSSWLWKAWICGGLLQRRRLGKAGKAGSEA